MGQAKAVQPPPHSRRFAVVEWKLLLLLAAITLALYLPTASNGFIDLDDDAYLWKNPHVRDGLTGSGLAWAFTTVDYFYWQPLTWISHMVDVEMYGMQAGGHHVTNALLHALNAALAAWVLLLLTGDKWKSLAVAALFAWHPLRVESVAWVAERKDLLSALFWLLCLAAYARYARDGWGRGYWWSVAAMAAGLAAKPTVVTLPFVLLLVDFWPLGRFGKDGAGAVVREKWPFFVLAAVSSVLTYAGQQQFGAMATATEYPVAVRVANAVASYGQYLYHTVVPYPLAMFYPYRVPVPGLWIAVGAALLVGLTGVAVWQWRARPYLAVGWFWFAGVLVPTLGLVQVGVQASADRFTYLPSLGLWIAIVWACGEVAVLRQRWVPIAVAGVFAVLTLGQLAHWKDSATVFAHTLSVTGSNPTIENNLANVYLDAGRVADALPLLEKAVAEQPQFYQAWVNLGTARARAGRMEEAAEAYRKAAAVRPDSGTPYLMLGILRTQQQGRSGEALEAFQKALSLSLNDTEAVQARVNVAVLLAQGGKPAEAEPHLREALRMAPADVAAHRTLVGVLLDQNRGEEAMKHLAYAIVVTGGNAELRQLQQALLQQGR